MYQFKLSTSYRNEMLPITDNVVRSVHYKDLLNRKCNLFQGFEENNSIGNLRLGNVKARLFIDCVAPRHQGTYTCVAVSGTETVVSQPSLLFVQGTLLISVQS